MTEQKKRKGQFLRAFTIILVVSAVLAGVPLTIRTFFYQAFKIPAGGMTPSLLVGDYILADKRQGEDLRRGDIIIFKWPPDPSKRFVKRIVGMPGETVEIRNRQVFINDAPLEEPYIIHTAGSGLIPGRDSFGPEILPRDHFFVLGDNREQSNDSRFWGWVSKSSVIGKASFIYFSFDAERQQVRWDRVGKPVRLE